MPDLDEVVGDPIVPVPGTAVTRLIAGWRRHWDFLAVLLLMAASLPLSWLSPSTVVLVQRPGTFDDNWVLDSAFKATRGIVFGRDVAFVYGPVFQWLMATPTRWPQFSMGAVYVSQRTLVLWFTFLLGYATLRLLLPEQAPWKRFLLLLLLAIFWAPPDGRTIFGIFLFALFLRGWYAVGEARIKRSLKERGKRIFRGLKPAWDDKNKGPRRWPKGQLYPNLPSRRPSQRDVMPLVFGAGSALLIAVAFLYSADTGVYGIAAWLLGLGGVAWEGRRESRRFAGYAVAAAGFAACLAVLVLGINSILAAPLDFRFWRTSLALVNVHRWNEAYPISSAGAIHLLAPVAIGAVLFLLRAFVPADRRVVITARPGFLLSAFLFGLLSLQSGLVRSDYNHIVFGVFPMVLFAGAVLFSFRSRLASAVVAVAAIVCSIVLSAPALAFQPTYLRFRLARMHRPIATCPGGFHEFDHACYPNGFAETLQTTVNYLQQHSGEHDSVLIFPYQYMFAVGARRNVAAGVEQSFLANGPYLSQFDIAGMEKARAQVGLYFSDASSDQLSSSLRSLPIDGVSNFTRTPAIWFWIFSRYRADQELAPGVVGLLRDDSREGRISVQPYPLELPTRRYPVDTRSEALELGAPDWPAGGADFLRLRLKVNYSPLWKFRKPERLQLEITLADGSRSRRTLVVEPNVVSEVWFYPWNEADLWRYFEANETRWRTSPRPAVTNLRLLLTPMDWISQQPESVVIEQADAVRFGMGR